MDNGDNWSPKMNGLTATEVRALTTEGGFLFAGTYGAGVFRNWNPGDHQWEEVNNGLAAKYITCMASSESVVLAGADRVNGNGGVFRSLDGGETWTDLFTGVSEFDVRALRFKGYGMIFAGTYGDGVFRSTDFGTTWEPVNNGLGCTQVWSLGVAMNGDLLAGTAGCGTGIYRSSDNGDTWVLSSDGLTTTDVTAIDQDMNGKLLAGTIPIFGVGGGVFNSEDWGMTWAEFNTGLGNLEVTSLESDWLGNDYAGTSAGVYKAGYYTTWSSINEELPSVRINSLRSEYYMASLFAGTTGCGVWMYPLPVGIEEQAANRGLIIFPNPSVDIITIYDQKNVNGTGQIVSVLSIDGKETVKVVIQTFPASVDVSRLRPGLYFIKTEGDHGISIGKFVKE